jgi:hypothetical protein
VLKKHVVNSGYVFAQGPPTLGKFLIGRLFHSLALSEAWKLLQSARNGG